ncbi:MAG: hypothetical protein II486_03805 [Thermoguttaceae bacterium]|nr:hypothetical protein [Thermoguttaceae bacterium]
MKKSIKKPIDGFIRDYVRIRDPFNRDHFPELESLNEDLAAQMYVFDCPITSVKFYTSDDWDRHYDPAIIVDFYNGEEIIFTANGVNIETSLRLFISDDDEEDDLKLYISNDHEEEDGVLKFCADPRIVAAYILAERLDALGYEGEIFQITRGWKITAALNPVFTRENSIKWLEKNYFIGKKALYNRAVECGDHRKEIYEEKEYPECWLENGFPGWDVYELERELAYVPPRAREVYDKYYSAWIRVEKEKRRQEAARRREEFKRKLEEKRRKLEEKLKEKREEEAKRKEREKKRKQEEKRRKQEDKKRRQEMAKYPPKPPLTPKEAKQNWTDIISAYEQIEQKKNGQ